MKKIIILLDGMSGAGKTTTKNYLAQNLPRTALVGMDAVKKFVSDFERGTRDNAIAREITIVMTKKYLELGLSIIVDQWSTEEEVTEFENIAKKHNIPCYKFQLFSDTETALKRVIARTKEYNGDLPIERAKRNISLFQNREHLGFTSIDTSALQKEEAGEIILKKIS